MTTRPLICPKCGAHVAITEDITGYLDWGLAVLGDDGVVRREEADCEPRIVMADNSRPVGRPRACCVNPGCGHQWRLRRPFDPQPAA
ncbi:hypothetical protein OG411_29835 [Streptomyces pseudogriseolus]|uniref:hypothetical protein n=1 Tax=Streptomyces pseudogriseolus TaxID=36817 RepID=UPI003250D9EC